MMAWLCVIEWRDGWSLGNTHGEIILYVWQRSGRFAEQKIDEARTVPGGELRADSSSPRASGRWG